MKAHFLICLALLAALAGCNQPAEDLSALEEEVERLKTGINDTKKLASGLRLELEHLAKGRDEGDAKLTRLIKAREELEAQLLSAKTDLMNYRNAYRDNIRQRAPGMKLDDFEAAGKSFSNVEVKAVDDWELSFKHSNGFSRIDFADAPPEIRILFAYNPNVGPKPEKVQIAAASFSSSGAGPNSTASPSQSGPASGGSESRTAVGSQGRSSGTFNDPFSNSRPQTVGTAIGETPSQKPVKRLQASKSTEGLNLYKLPDGTWVEVIHAW